MESANGSNTSFFSNWSELNGSKSQKSDFLYLYCCIRNVKLYNGKKSLIVRVPDDSLDYLYRGSWKEKGFWVFMTYFEAVAVSKDL